MEKTNKTELPYVCPDHPTVKISLNWNEMTYFWNVGGLIMPYTITFRKWECAVCGRELAPEDSL